MFRLLVLFALFFIVKTHKQSDLVLLGQLKNDQLELRCATTEVAKAITWNTPINNSFIRTDVIKPNINELVPENWRIVTDSLSLKSNFEPVLDERWEDLTTIYSNPNRTSNFEKLGTIRSYSNTYIPISVRIKQEGHIFICKNRNVLPPMNDCYWIILGGWKGNKNVLRKCFQAAGDCKINLAQNETNKLNENEWKHFTIHLNEENKSISVVFDGDDTPLLYYEDGDLFDEIGEIYVQSKLGHGGFWKLHDYKVYVLRGQEMNKEHLAFFLQSTKYSICVSMYVAICDNCILSLYLKYNPGNFSIKEQSYLKKKGGTWQKITFAAVQLQHTYNNYSLFIKVTGKFRNTDEIAFSNIKLHLSTNYNCFYNEVKYSILRVDPKDKQKVTCHYLLNDRLDKENSTIKIQKPSRSPVLANRCGPEAVGSRCLSCLSIYNTKVCESTIVCENQRCYCLQEYEGPLCNISQLPILLEAPEVITPCTTRCEIRFNPEKYLGSTPPVAYVIQYKESNKINWKDANGPSPLIENPVNLNGFKANTSYILRIYLTTKLGKAYKEGIHIPEVHFTTSCKKIQLKDIKINIGNSSAELVLNSEKQLCNFEDYYVNVTRLGQDQFSTKLKSITVIKKLLPFTTYNVTILGRNLSLYINFTTSEQFLPVLLEAPKVATPCYTTCLITFNATKYRGIAPYVYKIEYKEQQHTVWCNTGFIQLIEIVNNYYVLNKLRKATNYTLRISLYTRGLETYKGKLKEISFMTSCSEVNRQDLNIIVTNTSAELRLNASEEREICNFETYNLRITTMHHNVTIYNKKLELNNNIDNLEPWATYNIIISSHNHIFITNFTAGLHPLEMIEKNQSNSIYSYYLLLLLVPLIIIVYISMRKYRVRFVCCT